MWMGAVCITWAAGAGPLVQLSAGQCRCSQGSPTWADVSPAWVSVPWCLATCSTLLAQAGKVAAPIMGICLGPAARLLSCGAPPSRAACARQLVTPCPRCVEALKLWLHSGHLAQVRLVASRCPDCCGDRASVLPLSQRGCKGFCEPHWSSRAKQAGKQTCGRCYCLNRPRCQIAGRSWLQGLC